MRRWSYHCGHSRILPRLIRSLWSFPPKNTPICACGPSHHLFSNWEISVSPQFRNSPLFFVSLHLHVSLLPRIYPVLFLLLVHSDHSLLFLGPLHLDLSFSHASSPFYFAFCHSDSSLSFFSTLLQLPFLLDPSNQIPLFVSLTSRDIFMYSGLWYTVAGKKWVVYMGTSSDEREASERCNDMRLSAGHRLL